MRFCVFLVITGSLTTRYKFTLFEYLILSRLRPVGKRIEFCFIFCRLYCFRIYLNQVWNEYFGFVTIFRSKKQEESKSRMPTTAKSTDKCICWLSFNLQGLGILFENQSVHKLTSKKVWKCFWNGSTLCILHINQQKCFEICSFVYFLIAR